MAFNKINSARIIGEYFFLLLAFINLGFALFSSGVAAVDILILIFCSLPILINNKLFSFAFGSIGLVLALYLFIAGLFFNSNQAIETSQGAYNLGYLLALSIGISSFLLLYSALNGYDSSLQQPVAPE